MVKTIECRSLPLVFAEVVSLVPSKYLGTVDRQENNRLVDLLEAPIFEEEFSIEDDFDRVQIQIGDNKPIDVLFGARMKNSDYYSSIFDLLGTDTIFLYDIREDLFTLGDLLREIYHSGTIPADGDERLTKIYDKLHKCFHFLSSLNISIGTNCVLTKYDLNFTKFQVLSEHYVERLVYTTSLIYAYNYLEKESGRNPISEPAEVAKLVLDLLEKELDKHPYDRPDPKVYKYMDHRNSMFNFLDRIFEILTEYDEAGYTPSAINNSRYFIYEVMKAYK